MCCYEATCMSPQKLLSLTCLTCYFIPVYLFFVFSHRNFLPMNLFYSTIGGMLILCFLLNGSYLCGQNVERVINDVQQRIEQSEWLGMSGGISAMANFNHTSGIDRRFDPFTWRLNANLNFNLLGINAPFFASISDGNTLYNLPSYAFYGISPTYKWATLHLGDRSMNFSPYTFSGHNFFGSGVELKPGKFHFSAMYGRLKRAVAEDLNSRQSLDPAFKRMGWGVKVGYNDGKNGMSVILFKAKDEIGSIPVPQQAIKVKPQENVVLGLVGKKQLGRVLSLSVDYARSALTLDQMGPVLESRPTDLDATMAGLFQPNATSGYHNAVKSSLGFKTRFGQFNLHHEWIDPGYRTLGALFFNNNMENITASTTTAFFQNKVAISANIGIQRNNLDNRASQSARRFIGSVTSSLKVNDNLNFNASYSNFSTTNRLRAVSIPFVQVDSIVLAQTNQSANLSGTYTKGKDRQSVWLAQLSYQKANAIENDVVQRDQSTVYYLGNLSYSLGLTASQFNLGASLLVNYGIIPNIDLLTISPSITCSKSFWDNKLKLGSTLVFSHVQSNGQLSNQVLNLRANAMYQFWKKHQLALDISWLNNQSLITSGNNSTFNESMGSLQYHFKF